MQWLGLEMVTAIEEGGYRKKCGFAGKQTTATVVLSASAHTQHARAFAFGP